MFGSGGALVGVAGQQPFPHKSGKSTASDPDIDAISSNS
jgi:hypothetical protein